MRPGALCSPCADERDIRRQYLPAQYGPREGAAGWLSAGARSPRGSYIPSGHADSVAGVLAHDPQPPAARRRNLPIYERQFYTGTSVQRGPAPEPPRRRPDYPHARDEVSVVIDQATLGEGRRMLEQRIARNQALLAGCDHPTRQSGQPQARLQTDYYNPSIRSHGVFKQRGFDDRQNFQRPAPIPDQLTDQSYAGQQRQFLRNAEKFFQVD